MNKQLDSFTFPCRFSFYFVWVVINLLRYKYHRINTSEL